MRINDLVLVGLKVPVVLMLIAILLTGCAESSFTLSRDSRLPKWFDVPNGTSRNDVNVTMAYYVKPDRREAVFELVDRNGRVLEQVVGIERGDRPIKLKIPPQGFPEGYPLYEVITVNGVTEIIEHRKMEPFFYITDDPAVWAELINKK